MIADININEKSNDAEDYYKVQLPLPFEEACTLEKNKKLRTLRDQACRIPDLKQWEINAFIELCELKDLQQKNSPSKFVSQDCVWLDRGLAIVYEYSGFIDEFQLTASKLILLRSVTKKNLTNSPIQTSSKQTLLQLISTSVFFIGRLINIVSNWRRLQSTPRLMLLFRSNDSSDNDEIKQSNTTWHLITNLCSILFELIKTQASADNQVEGDGEMEKKISSFIKYLSTELTVDEIALLFSPIMEHSQFSSLLRFERKFQLCPPMNSTENSMNEDEIFVIFNHIRKFLAMEKFFLDAYQGDRLLAQAMIERLPTFRLPYSPFVSDLKDEVHLYDLESHNPFKWFPATSTYTLYESLGKNFRMSTSPAAADSFNGRNVNGAGSKPSEMQSFSHTFRSMPDLRSTIKPLVLPSLSPVGFRRGSPPFSPVQNNITFASLEDEPTFGRRYTDSTEATGTSDTDTVGLRSAHNSKPMRPKEVTNAAASPPSSLIKSRALLAPLETPSRRNSKSSESITTNVDIFSPSTLVRQPNRSLSDTAADLKKSKTASNAFFKIGISQKSNLLGNSLLLERRLLRAVEIISKWWLFYLPRRRLLYRMELRSLTLSIIQDITSTVYRIALSRQKQRKHLLHYGCACKIQHLVRRFLSRRLRLSIRSSYRSVSSGNSNSNNQKKLRYQARRPPPRVLSSAEEKDRRIAAARIIQRNIRGWLQRITCEYWRKKRVTFMSKILVFLCTSVLKLRRWKIKRKIAAAIVIQKHIRGKLARNAMFKYVQAVIFLVTFWRRRMAYKAIRLRLRRIEKPCTVILHGLRNMVPRKHIASNVLRFRVSVWWHPLLHMVSENDFAVIIETRKPQFVYTSEPHNVIDDTKAADIMTGGCHIRRLPKEDVESAAASNLQRSIPRRAKSTRPMRQLRYMRVSTIQRKLDAAEIRNLKNKKKKNKQKHGSGADDDDDDDEEDDDDDDNGNDDNGVQEESSGLITKTEALSAFGLTRRRSMYSIILSNIQARMVAKKARKAQEATSSSRAEIYRMRVPSILPSALLKMQKSNSVQSKVAPSVEEPRSEKSRTQSSNESSTGKSVDESSTRRQSMLTRSNATVGRSNLQAMDDSMLKEEENEDDSDSDDEDEDDDEDGDSDGEDEGAKTAAMKEALSSLQQSNPGVNTRVLNRSSSQSGRGRQSSLSPSIIAPRVSISAAGARMNESSSRRPSSRGELLNRASIMVRQSFKSISNLTFSRTPSGDVQKDDSSKKMCDFKDEKVKIPGCHGNSVVQFEILEGEEQRKIGSSLFCMSQQNDLMFWGGEYRDEMKITRSKRATTMPLKASPGMKPEESQNNLGPVLEFKIIGGAARKSRCQWGRVMVHGKGPLRAIMRSREGFWQSLFENWERFFLSIDEDGLGFYESKFSLKPVHCIPLMDMKDLYGEMSPPTDLAGAKHDPTSSGKTIIEDLHTTILVTYSGDEIYIRFPDQNSVLAWQDSIDSAIQVCHKERTRIKRKGAVIGLPGLSLITHQTLLQAQSSVSSSLLRNRSISTAGRRKSRSQLMARRMSVGSIQVHGSGGDGGGAKALAQGKGVGISSPTTAANVGNMVSMGRKLLPPPSQPSPLPSTAQKAKTASSTATAAAKGKQLVEDEEGGIDESAMASQDES